MKRKFGILFLGGVLLMAPLGCGEEGDAGPSVDEVATTEGARSKAAGSSAAREYFTFTLEGPEIPGVTYSFDPEDLSVTVIPGHTSVQGLQLVSKEGYPFVNLILVVSGNEPGSYDSREGQSEFTIAVTPEGGTGHYALKEQYRDSDTGIVIDLQNVEGALEGTFQGTLARSNKSGARQGALIPVYELSDGSFRLIR